MFKSVLSKVLLGICLFVLFILLAIPSASLIMDYFAEKTRDGIAEYIVFSHTLHMRSYWAMSNIDYAMEAGRNYGDFNHTTEYFLVYANRAHQQTTLAQRELGNYRSMVPSQAQASFDYMENCIDDLDDLASSLARLHVGVVSSSSISRDSLITDWNERESLRTRFSLREGSLKNTRSDAVRNGYDWVYEDMRLRAVYDIMLEQGQTMFQSSYF